MSDSNNNNNNNNGETDGGLKHRGGGTTSQQHNMDDDDDSVLSLSEQINRPPDTALHQQRVNAWHPILDPVWVIVALFYLGVILVPVGFKIDSIQKNVEELMVTYDGREDNVEYVIDFDDETNCRIGDNYNADHNCIVSVTTTQDLYPPILVHYRLENFHQNHRSYYKSKDPFQLLGKIDGQDPISEADCKPLNKLGNITINPCGLIANTFFNDKFTLLEGKDAFNQNLTLIEEGIAWQSDIDYVYAQPEGFEYSECTVCDESCCNIDDSCINGQPTIYKDKCYRYKYPNDNTTQYLYETYPKIINPIEGVTNEHFIVWMRIATQPDFRKLYGWFDQPILKDTKLTFQINNNYVVTRFNGKKSIIIGTTSIFGGRNPYFAPVFIWVGVFCLISGAFFALKHTFRPRKLADPVYLHYKEE